MPYRLRPTPPPSCTTSQGAHILSAALDALLLLLLLLQYDVLVTPGANQAFVDVMLVLNDAPATRGSGQAAVQRSGVVLFPPYYFDFHMALTVRLAGRHARRAAA